MRPSDQPTPTPSTAPWLPFLGAALRLRRHNLKLRSADVDHAIRSQSGRACSVLRYEAPVVESVFGRVCYGAPCMDPNIKMMVRLAQALNWTVPAWIAAAEDLHAQHEAAVARAALEQGLGRDELVAALKAGQWRSPT